MNIGLLVNIEEYEMKLFDKNSTAMLIVDLVLELEKYKKAYKQQKADNECLKRLLQTKQNFEVRG